MLSVITENLDFSYVQPRKFVRQVIRLGKQLKRIKYSRKIRKKIVQRRGRYDTLKPPPFPREHANELYYAIVPDNV